MSGRRGDLSAGRRPDDAMLVRHWRLWSERHESTTTMRTAMTGVETILSAPPCPIPLMGQEPHSTHENGGSCVAAGDILSATRTVLRRWNSAFASPAEDDKEALLKQACWLVEHEVMTAPEAGGWPLPVAGGQALSATMQGLALTVLARAYLLTGQEQFLACARRSAQTFMLDILDGGVCAPVGSGENAGVVFEGAALYPAAHQLEAFLVAILSLYDLGALTDDVQVRMLAQRGHATLHSLLGAYDIGYRVRSDLLNAPLANRNVHAYLARLLAALATCSECEQCQVTAEQWAMYSRSMMKRMRYRMARARHMWRSGLWALAGRTLRVQPGRAVTIRPYRVCAPITAYPVGGGIRAVMTGWRKAMACDWTMEFLTAYIGPDAEGQTIYSFAPHIPVLGARAISRSLFPNVIGYVLAGVAGLLRLLRQTPDYAVLLPQDGVYTAAFTAVCAKLTGRRLVIVDHGNIRDIFDPQYIAERRQSLTHLSWLRRRVGQLRLAFYMPTVRALARFAARHSDHILAASEDIVESYQRHLNISAHRITRFPFMLDADRYAPPDATTRSRRREAIGLPEGAIVIIMVNRLHPMKGMDVGVSALRKSIDALPPNLRSHVRIVIVGDGTLREQVAADIRDAGLEDICRMWGEASADDVAMLLGVSDIFLFSARRSINSMAVLEAMAAGCATVATVTSQHIAEYLQDRRGITAPVGDVDALADALSTLIRDDARRQAMGKNARNYVVAHHTGEVVRRHLLRATYWQPTLESGDANCRS